MTKTVTFTQQELDTLKAYLFCDPCERGCLYGYKKINCQSVSKDGLPTCGLLRNKKIIREKLYGRGHE